MIAAAAAAAVGHRRIAACQIFIGGQWENFAPTDHSYLRGEMVNQKLYTYRAQSYFRKKDEQLAYEYVHS